MKWFHNWFHAILWRRPAWKCRQIWSERPFKIPRRSTLRWIQREMLQSLCSMVCHFICIVFFSFHAFVFLECDTHLTTNAKGNRTDKKDDLRHPRFSPIDDSVTSLPLNYTSTASPNFPRLPLYGARRKLSPRLIDWMMMRADRSSHYSQLTYTSSLVIHESSLYNTFSF